MCPPSGRTSTSSNSPSPRSSVTGPKLSRPGILYHISHMAVSRFKERLAFLKPYLLRRKTPILFGWIFVLVSTALDQVSPWMIMMIIDSLQAGKGYAGIVPPLLAILGATLVGGVLLYYQRLW